MNLVAKQMANDRSAISNSYTVKKGNQVMKSIENIFDCTVSDDDANGLLGQMFAASIIGMLLAITLYMGVFYCL